MLGLSFFSGIGVFVLALFVNVFLGLKLEHHNTALMKRKDKRMNYTNESLVNIKTLKFYSWTTSFENEIQNRRLTEMKSMKKIAIWLSLLITSIYFFPNVLSSVVFSTYIGIGHSIDLATAFSVIIFFDLIIEPMINFPMFISSYVDFRVSMKRVQEFLSSKEIDMPNLINQVENSQYSIEIKNHNFSWGIKEKTEEDEKKKETDKKTPEKKVEEEEIKEVEEPLLDDKKEMAKDEI